MIVCWRLEKAPGWRFFLFKTRQSHRFLWTLIAVLAMALAVVGCEDDPVDPDDEGADSRISLVSVIVNPKAPAPGDTINLTVVLSAAAPGGSAPTVTWSASGGTFLESNELSVRWVAPATVSLQTVSVIATNSVNSVNASRTVFVSGTTELVSSAAGQIYLQPNGSDFYYLRSTLAIDNPNLDGWELYEYSGGSSTEVVAGGGLEGFAFSAASDLSQFAFMFLAFAVQSIEPPLEVFITDTGAGTETLMADDKAPGVRKQEFWYPQFSPDDAYITYGSFLPDPTLGNTDTFDVWIQDVATRNRVRATGTHGGERRNFFPSFSPDGNWVVFLSDRQSRGAWEWYGLPFAGGVVDTIQANTAKLSTTGGIVSSGAADLTLERPTHTWNPVDPIMAFVDSQGNLHLMTLTLAGGTSQEILGLDGGSIQDIVWSPDGAELAVSTGGFLYVVGQAGGAPTEIYAAPGSDQLEDIVWAPNRSYFIWRLRRSQNNWFEFFDRSAGTSLTAPLVLTSAISTGQVSSYRGVMDVRGVINSSNEFIALTFEGTTPKVVTLDVSPILP